MIMIKLKQVYKTNQLGKQNHTVLHDINLDIKQGEMVALMGASGSGKSTIMNIVGLLDKPSQGKYLLHGMDTSSLSENEMADIRNQTIGFVFQQFFLLPKLSAADNIALPLQYRGHSKKEVEALVLSMLERVGMQDKANHKPSELSGGQQQRVALARALIGEPNIILADEPTGALDSTTSQEVMALFQALHHQEGRTLFIITHDREVADQCQRQIEIKDGRIIG